MHRHPKARTAVVAAVAFGAWGCGAASPPVESGPPVSTATPSEAAARTAASVGSTSAEPARVEQTNVAATAPDAGGRGPGPPVRDLGHVIDEAEAVVDVARALERTEVDEFRAPLVRWLGENAAPRANELREAASGEGPERHDTLLLLAEEIDARGRRAGGELHVGDGDGMARSLERLERAIPRPARGGSTAGRYGRISPEAVQLVVRAHFAKMRRCYEEGLGRRPDLSGRISTKFVIDRQGDIAMAGDGGSTLPDPEIVRCVVGAFSELRFGPPRGDGLVTVVYPIVFAPRE